MYQTPCQMMALKVLHDHEDHYHAYQAAEANVEFLDNYKGKKGFFLKKFLIDDTFNLNDWKVTWEAIKQDIWDFRGKPLVLTPEIDHPSVEQQEDFRVGNIIDVGLDEVNRKAWQVSEVFDKTAQQLIEQRKVRFGSPTVLPFSPDTREQRFKGTQYQQDILHRFRPAHDAIVRNPAYTKDKNKFAAVCKGDGEQCAMKLLAVNASVEYRQRYEADNPVVNGTNTDQITIVDFVKKSLNKRYNADTLKAIIENLRDTQEADTDNCVEKKIRIISNEHKEWDHDKVIAVAFSYCGDTLEAAMDISGKGHWITVRGTHIFIKQGESVDDAIKKKFGDYDNKKDKVEHHPDGHNPNNPELHEGPKQKESGMPMGTGKEGRQARQEYFKESDMFNTELGDLQESIAVTTLNRNFAKVYMQKEKEGTPEFEKLKQDYETHKKELARLEHRRDVSEQWALKLGKLEGVEAQKTLAAIKREKAAADLAKPNSKKHMKHMMNVIAYEHRLDMLRRGELDDFNRAGDKITPERPTPKTPLLNIPDAPNTHKQENLVWDIPFAKPHSDFTVNKEHNTSRESVEKISKLWNEIPDNMREHIKGLNIRDSEAEGKYLHGGEWKPHEKELHMTINKKFDDATITDTFYHELGHAKYDRMKTEAPEKIKEWKEKIKPLLPPTHYADYHKKRLRKHEDNLLFGRLDADEKEIEKKNIAMLEELYYDEVHAEVHAYHYGKGIKPQNIAYVESMNLATKAFKEMHGL